MGISNALTPSADRPRFRQDLVAEPIEDGGSKFIDVMDPDSGTLFRFFEVEYSLACAMDGQRDVAGIVRWAEEELGLKPSANEVKMVISTLGDLGYLEGGAAARAAATAAPIAATPVAAAPAAKAEPPSRPTPPPRPAGKATPPAGTPVARTKTPPGGATTNRWDQPTAMGDTDDYLQAGVVAGAAKPVAPSGANVELGAPGARREKSDELPRAPDLELGAPGTSPSASRAPAAAKGADIALGASGRGAEGVSVDLADHVDVGAADVKEAVRASQVMKAVDVPPELASELESKPTAKAAASDKATKAAVQSAASDKAAAVAAEKSAASDKAAKAADKTAASDKAASKAADKTAASDKAAAKAAEKPAAKPVEKPAAKPVEKRPSVTPTAPRAGVSPVLIAALVIAVLAAGGFALYKYVLKKDTNTASSVKTPPPPPKQPEPPPPPPIESQKLATEQAPPEEIKPSGAGQIATLVAADTVVKAGDPVAKLVGFKSLEADMATLDKAVTKGKTDVAAAEKERDAAQAAGNKAGVTAAEKKLSTAQKALEDAQTKATAKQAALDKFLLKAPAAGKVTIVAKPNQKITPTDVVATVTRDPVLVATFKKADGATQDAAVTLAVKGTEQKLACNVVMASGDGTKIACPKDAAPEGSEVTYVGVDTSRPAGETPPATPEAGSAAGSAAPAAGSAAPAAGSAAGSAAPAAGSAAPAEKAPAKAEKKAPAPRPRPVVRPKAPAVDKSAGSDKATGDKATGDKAGGDTATPAPTPAPAPAGSGGGLQ